MNSKILMKNVLTSRFNNERCYVYNKAFGRFYDNHQTHDILGGNLEDVHMQDQYDGKTRSGALSPCGNPEYTKRKCEDCDCDINPTHFDLIRIWANDRGLYENGDPKTQALKLVEEVGETCRAILKEDRAEAIDGIGDCVVVLTNLAELLEMRIEDCIREAYNEIKDRTGKMANGTYVKND